MPISNCWGCCSKNKVSSIPPGLDENGKSVKSMSVEERCNLAQDTENVYATLVRVVKNYVGKPTYPYLAEAESLYSYILFLCGKHEHDPNTEKWMRRKVQDMQLIVVIKEAKLLYLKTGDSGHVMCKMWIDKSKSQNTASKSLHSGPIWDEVFILDVSDYDNDEITIEVWFSCEKKRQVFYSSYSLVGSIIKPIKNLPCIGQEKMCTIKDRDKNKQTKGQLCIYVQLTTKQTGEHVYNVQMHMELMKMCYERHLPSLKLDVQWKNWLEVLPNVALTLLQQHGLQNGLTPIEQSVCSWILASTLRINGEYRISFFFLYGLLEGLLNDVQKNPIEGTLESAFYSSITSFFNYMLANIQTLHGTFQLQYEEQADDLFFMLKCLSCTDVTELFSYLDYYSEIAEEGEFWYYSVLIDHKEDLQAQDIAVKTSCEILKNIIKIYLQNQIVLDDIFTKAWSVNYSNIILASLDTVMHDAIRPYIEYLRQVMEITKSERDVKESLEMLQLYHTVRELVNYVVKNQASERESLAMDKYFLWFGEDLILEWFLLCDMFTKPFIKDAVKLDQMEPLHKDICYGSSYEDVVSIIDQMVYDVWPKLSREEQFYTHAALIDAIKSCVLIYAVAISKKVRAENYFCGNKEFVPNKRMCVALSNAFSIFEHLYTTKDKIKSVLRMAEHLYGFTIIDPMASIGSTLQIEISGLYLSVMEQIKYKFKKLSRKVVKVPLDVLGSHATIVADTCTFVENTLELLYQNLKEEAFYIMLRQMWIMVVVCFRDELTLWKGCALVLIRRSAYISALQALAQIQNIFYCDGHGLSYFEMDCEIVNDLKEKIERRVGHRNH